MFTGIIEAVAEIVSSESTDEILTLHIATPVDWETLVLGQSIAVNGACLSVSAINNTDNTFAVQLMPETISRTIFGSNQPQIVNLERAMSASARFEGHIVQGHIDSTAIVQKVGETQEWRTITFTFDESYSSLVIEKGSVAINGVSLTVADVNAEQLTVALIPITLKDTTLGELKLGDKVNIEFDYLAKIIQAQQG